MLQDTSPLDDYVVRLDSDSQVRMLTYACLLQDAAPLDDYVVSSDRDGCGGERAGEREPQLRSSRPLLGRELRAEARDRFVWNTHLLKPLLHTSTRHPYIFH